MSFADLKRKSQSNFDFLQKELTKSTKEGGADERLWKPQLDKSGNGYAVIRFLPAPEGESLSLGSFVLPRLPRSWWLVDRQLPHH